MTPGQGYDMTKDEADEIIQDIEGIVKRLGRVCEGLADQEFGETDDPELSEVIINIDDGDIEGWFDDIGHQNEQLTTIQNKLSGHL